MTAPTTGWPPIHLQDLNVKVREYLKAVRATAAIIFDHQTGAVTIEPVFAVDLDTEPASSIPASPSTLGAPAHD